MEKQMYQFRGGPGLDFDVTVSDQGLSVTNTLLRRTTEILAANIQKIRIAKTFAKAKLFVHYTEAGKEKKAFVVMEAYDRHSAFFVKHLKALVPDASKWQNEFDIQTGVGQTRTYPLSSRMFGKYANRTGILFFWGLMSLTLILFPVFLYLLITKAYQVVVDDNGLAVKKLSGKKFSWTDIGVISLSLIDVTFKSYGASVAKSRFCQFQVQTHDGKTETFMTDAISGAQLVKEFSLRKKLDKDYSEEVAI